MAGFWKRFAAIFIDAVLLSFVNFTIIILPGIFFLRAHPGMPREAFTQEFGPYFMIVRFIPSVLTILYFSLMECSGWQATLGKKVLGIKVTDLEGNRISFGKALLRNISKILSGFFMIGYIMAAFTENKQALHDMITGCFVVNDDSAEDHEYDHMHQDTGELM